MAFIEPMHRNKPNVTYLLFSYSIQEYDDEDSSSGGL